MKSTVIIIMFILSISLSFSQQQYFVSKDGTGNFSTIAQVNSASLNSGDIVAFKGGEQFADAVLNCKSGVTYTSFGNGQAIIGDSLGNRSTETTINIDVENVKIDNLKVYGYRYSWRVISYSKGNLTITNCEIIGGLGAHDNSRYGISQSNHSASGGRNLKFQRNKIYGFGGGAIYFSRPFDVDISYNEMYDLWRLGATMNLGAIAITRAVFSDENNPADVWDCAYTVNIHHNNIHHFEMSAFMGYSRMIIEYNEIHHNLDERIYRGGVKHGNVGKIYDNTGYSDNGTTGSLGIIVRYNYIHDLVRRGEPNHTYDVPTQWHRDNGIPNTVSTNNGTGKAIYLNAVTDNMVGFGEHFGDGYGESPDMVISGLGYGNYWIHNNLFYNCSNQICGRSFNHLTAYRPELVSYFVNNTILNSGWREYVTDDNGLMITRDNSQSPHTVVNNIIDYTLTKSRYMGRWWEKDIYLGFNIYLNQTGTTTSLPQIGSNYASCFEYEAVGTIPVNEQYLVPDEDIWSDTSTFIFASDLGVDGCHIPDARIKPHGAAYNSGKSYSTLGDNFSIQALYWSEKHTLGQDPTGRSFAYDLLGNLRTTNDIGAVGIAGNPITPTQTGLKVILEGSYVNGKMRTDLNSSKFLPLNQPYNVEPWNINREIIINNIAENYVDWVLVQVRDDLTNTKYTKEAILTEDGIVLNPDGSSFSFLGLSSGEYYLVIKHRNHLSIMSAQKVLIEKSKSVEYNFTDSQSKAYGENSMVRLDDSKYAMIAGDGDANGVINVLDFGAVANNILLRGYTQGDTDMNGSVNVLDYSYINRNLLKASNLP